MFSNQRRGSVGLGSLVGVALVLVGFLTSAGLMVKTYRDGGKFSSDSRCEIVCRPLTTPAAKG